MKATVNGITLDLIQYKGNPQLWWDGKDATKLYKWEEFRTVGATNINSSYSALRLKVGISIRGTHSVTNTND